MNQKIWRISSQIQFAPSSNRYHIYFPSTIISIVVIIIIIMMMIIIIVDSNTSNAYFKLILDISVQIFHVQIELNYSWTCYSLSLLHLSIRPVLSHRPSVCHSTPQPVCGKCLKKQTFLFNLGVANRKKVPFHAKVLCAAHSIKSLITVCQLFLWYLHLM